MSISESQLITWSHQGAISTAKYTHESLRYTLQSFQPQYQELLTYLQGSYANDTNIRGDSDVDLVVQSDAIFQRDISALTPYDLAAYKTSFSDATYTWSQLRSEIFAILVGRYGATNVESGSKSIKVKADSGRLKADVVVCIEYRRYIRFRSLSDQDYVSGMTFYVPIEQRWVVNYPRLHYSNGVKKHQATSSWYKPFVRIVKNFRSWLVDNEIIKSSLAPSYFIECLLYNVPNDLFGTSYQQTFQSIFTWLNTANLTQFVCRNEQLPLFGAGSDQWREEDARTFIQYCLAVWKVINF